MTLPGLTPGVSHIEGKSEIEGAAASLSALEPHPSAVQVDNLPRDEEIYSHSSVVVPGSSVGPEEPLEDPGLHLGRDADALIRH